MMNAKLGAFHSRKEYDRNFKKKTPSKSKYNLHNGHNEHNRKEHKKIKSSLISTNTQNKDIANRKPSRKFNYTQ